MPLVVQRHGRRPEAVVPLQKLHQRHLCFVGVVVVVFGWGFGWVGDWVVVLGYMCMHEHQQQQQDDDMLRSVLITTASPSLHIHTHTYKHTHIYRDTYRVEEEVGVALRLDHEPVLGARVDEGVLPLVATLLLGLFFLWRGCLFLLEEGQSVGQSTGWLVVVVFFC